jgi:hypothetical protein
MAGLDISDPHLSGGGGLEEMGLGDVKRANQGMEAAAYSQSEREQYNARVKSSNVTGIQGLVAGAATIVGTVYGGPVGGALAGSAAGMVTGQLMK